MINIKKFITRVFILLCVFIGMVAMLVIYDLYLHKKHSEKKDFNYRGYRGEVVGKKEPNEIRIGVFGGSKAMGYRLPYSESIAGFLQKLIDSKDCNKKYTVVNLAARQELVSKHLMSTYDIFSYLDVDVLIVYFYNMPVAIEDDPTEFEFIPHGYSERNGNWILRNFNYYFIFPTIFKEKYYLLRYRSITVGYKKDRIFKKIDSLLEHWRIAAFEKEDDKKNFYDFVSELTSQGKIFIFTFAPSEIRGKSDYWQDLKIYFKKKFADNPQVMTADLRGAFSGGRMAMYFVDDFHYSEIGNHRIAERLSHYIPFDVLEKM